MTNLKNKNELKRVNMNLPINLIERVKEYADSLGINTTSAYIVLLNQALNQTQSVNSMPIILDMYSKMMNATNGDMSLLFNNNFNDNFNDINNKLDQKMENIKLDDKK